MDSDLSSLSIVNMAVYNAAILTWFVYVLMPESTQRGGSMLKTKRWNQELGEIRAEVSGETLIPRFESIVEKALARSDDSAEDTTSTSSGSYYGIRNSR